MSDDVLTGAIAGKLRLLPEVQQLYPPRPAAILPIATLTGLVTELVVDDAVSIDGARRRVEVSVGITGGRSAIAVAEDCIAAIRDAVPGADAPPTVRIRIASID